MKDTLKHELLNNFIIKRHSCFFANFLKFKNQTQFLNTIALHLEHGVDIIELSGEGMTDKEFLDTALKTKQLCEIYNATFIIKNRADIAYLTSADCVNLEQNCLDILSVRKIIGEKVLIGNYIKSADSSELVLVKDGADYIFKYDTTPTEPANITGLEYAKWVSEKPPLAILNFK